MNFWAIILQLLLTLAGVGAMELTGAAEASDQLTSKSQVEGKLHLSTRSDDGVRSNFMSR